jgi:alkylation response protein AidB-like acyl-CoA dehydrogenase
VSDERETVEEFRLRARAWLADNLPPFEGMSSGNFQEEGRRDHERSLQRRLFEGGFAGICWPADYGGLGLTIEHQRAFTEESQPYDMPYSLNVPTFGQSGRTIESVGRTKRKGR